MVMAVMWKTPTLELQHLRKTEYMLVEEEREGGGREALEEEEEMTDIAGGGIEAEWTRGEDEGKKQKKQLGIVAHEMRKW